MQMGPSGQHCHQSIQQKLEVHHALVNPLRRNSFMHRQPRHGVRSSAWTAVLETKQSLINSLLQPAPSTAASKDAAQEGIVGTSKASRKRQRHRRQISCCSSTFADADVQAPDSAGPQSGRHRSHDLVTLGNLCVDIVLEVPELPSPDVNQRKLLLRQLTASAPPQEVWEVGANANTIIAALRLGLNVVAAGHLGLDMYGVFMREVLQVVLGRHLGANIEPLLVRGAAGESTGPLQEEGIAVIEPLADLDHLTPELKETLLCFVLVGPGSQHAFCSRYDFGPWPLLPGILSVPQNISRVLCDTHAVHLNGFVLDELPPELVVAMLSEARRAGAAVFFDPGPRCWTLLEGTRRAALDAILDLSDVVLMTTEEGAAVTGHSEPHAAMRSVLSRPRSCTQWCIVKQGGQGSMLLTRDSPEVFDQPALKVPVADTVGCGDSFAAAIILGFIRGHSIPETLALANAVGAATATGRGAGRNVARAQTVQSLLDRQASMRAPSASVEPYQAASQALRRSLSNVATSCLAQTPCRGGSPADSLVCWPAAWNPVCSRSDAGVNLQHCGWRRRHNAASSTGIYFSKA